MSINADGARGDVRVHVLFNGGDNNPFRFDLLSGVCEVLAQCRLCNSDEQQ